MYKDIFFKRVQSDWKDYDVQNMVIEFYHDEDNDSFYGVPVVHDGNTVIFIKMKNAIEEEVEDNKDFEHSWKAYDGFIVVDDLYKWLAEEQRMSAELICDSSVDSIIYGCGEDILLGKCKKTYDDIYKYLQDIHDLFPSQTYDLNKLIEEHKLVVTGGWMPINVFSIKMSVE